MQFKTIRGSAPSYDYLTMILKAKLKLVRQQSFKASPNTKVNICRAMKLKLHTVYSIPIDRHFSLNNKRERTETGIYVRQNPLTPLCLLAYVKQTKYASMHYTLILYKKILGDIVRLDTKEKPPSFTVKGRLGGGEGQGVFPPHNRMYNTAKL